MIIEHTTEIPLRPGTLKNRESALNLAISKKTLKKPWIRAKNKKILEFCLSTGILVFGAPHGVVLISCHEPGDPWDLTLVGHMGSLTGSSLTAEEKIHP